MGIKITTNKGMENFSSNVSKAIGEEIKRKIEACEPKVVEKLADKLDERVHEFFDKSISDFYRDYEPRFYNRRTQNGLSHLLFTEKGKDYFQYWFDPEVMPYRNGYAGENGLYKTVFKEGWHGGANLDGNMLVPYRTNYSDGSYSTIAYDGISKSSTRTYERPYEYSKARWQPAVKAEISPYENFLKQKEEYEKKQLNIDYQEIWDDVITKEGLRKE